MEPVYRNIEFCRSPDTLWGKLREGRWDWLGVHPKSGFVLGSPRRSGVIEAHYGMKVIRADGKAGDGVRIFLDPPHPDLFEELWCEDAGEATALFEERVRTYEGREGPLLLKVELVRDGKVAERKFVVKAPPTYGVWRPAPS